MKWFLCVACLMIAWTSAGGGDKSFELPPPLPDHVDLSVVDEPESAFYSLGRTLWHLGRNADMILRFHEWLQNNGESIDDLVPDNLKPPSGLHRILLEPERVTDNGWSIEEDWIRAARGHRGRTATLPLHIRQSGRYRIWVRYLAHDDGTAVTRLTIRPSDSTDERPWVDEEFHTQVHPEAGPRWHSFIADLDQGPYTIRLSHVVRNHHVANNVAFKDHSVDCLYFTEELWAEPPSDSIRAAYRERSPEALIAAVIPVDAHLLRLWRRWQVRPLEWECARQYPQLFRLGYAFWRADLADLAAMDYHADPTDPVHRGIADYRDPRRQVVFDPVWNMLSNPYRARKQIGILRSDVDDGARDSFFENLAPGRFPVVIGQWQRSGGGLSADHAARRGNAMEVYRLPGPGSWHLWANFKNINYFEFFGIRVHNTEAGGVVDWQRTERNYPGGRSAWAKAGIIEIPALSSEEEMEQLRKSEEGIFVQDGDAYFIFFNADEWGDKDEGVVSLKRGMNLVAPVGLTGNEDRWTAKARLTILEADEGEEPSLPSFLFFDSNGLLPNRIGFDGALSGALFSNPPDLAFAWQAAIETGNPFDFEISGKGTNITLRIGESEPQPLSLNGIPSGRFGFTSGSRPLHIHEFSASGALISSLEMRTRLHIDVYMDRYINPRTFRGVYGLRVTDDEDYVPEGNVAPVASPKRYLNALEAMALSTDAGYVMNIAKGVQAVGQAWMPSEAEPADPAVDLIMAKAAVRSATLRFRNLENHPVVLHPRIEALKRGEQSYPNALQWRVVSFVPYGNKREEWSPFFLLRRPLMVVPPRGTAQIWLTVDSRNLQPGQYEGKLQIKSLSMDGSTHYPERTVSISLRVADVEIRPEQPILLHGWTQPPDGREYRDEWFRRFNVWQGPFMSKSEAETAGVRLQIYPQWEPNERQIRSRIEAAKAFDLSSDDYMFSIADEPTGTTEKALDKYIRISKLIRGIDPDARITMNPGEAARAATFRILQPYVDLWNPYALHLTYGPSGRDYLKKPWIWYTTPCYQDKTPGIASQMYSQIRSVLSQPGDCRGTALFAPYYPWRDPWDTAYEHIRDVSVFFAPSRHGLVATPAWEALLEARQHADLARLVRERADAADDAAKSLWEKGDSEAIIEWLEK